MGTEFPGSGMEDPFVYSGESVDEYSEKASLSPWTPVPDSVARRIFDRAEPKDTDIHVELGSGDGRVNFFAIESGVKESIGIDVDEEIRKFAEKQGFPGTLMKLGNIIGDDAPEVWKYLKSATGAKDPTWNFRGKFLVDKEGNVSVPKGNVEAEIESLM